MNRFKKLFGKVESATENEPAHDGLRIGMADGSYLVCGASPESKNGTFDADGKRIKESEIRSSPVKARKGDN